MNKLKSFNIVAMVALLLSFSSCEDYFGDVNVDPNQPTDVPVNLILPTAQIRLAYAMGGDASRYLGILTQQIDGNNRQFVVYQNYGLTPGDLDNLWGGALYGGSLKDIRQIINKSKEAGYHHYHAVGNLMEAYGMMFVADMFGDAPYSECFQGPDNLQPKFDSQEALYTSIFSLIDEAVTLLAGPSGDIKPGADDLFYAGNVAKWTKFAHTLKARGHLHLAKRDAGNYSKALAELANGFTSSDDDAQLAFGDNSTSSNPWFQYIEQRSDIEIGDSYVALMNSLNDPRVDKYGVTLVGNEDHPILTRNRPQPMLTYTEAKFIEAEAKMKTSGAADAKAPFLAGIAASFADAGVGGYDTYVAQASVNPATLTMNEILTQKYIALFLDPEVFNDWRRTGIPSLTPNSGSEIPRRLPYSQEEILYNLNTPSPADVTIFTRVWWDQ